ncbi:hypothetical protein Hanom_Chr07g00592011 [Helianthus anomalus]
MISSCQKRPLNSFCKLTNGLLALLWERYGNPVFTPSPKWSHVTYNFTIT